MKAPNYYAYYCKSIFQQFYQQAKNVQKVFGEFRWFKTLKDHVFLSRPSDSANMVNHDRCGRGHRQGTADHVEQLDLADRQGLKYM